MLKPVTQTETFRQLMEELRGESKAAADSLVFPGWCKNVARVLIRECSLVYKWRQDVEWDGPHTIRHGASQDSGLVDPVIDKMRRGGWRSKRSLRWYQRGHRS